MENEIVVLMKNESGEIVAFELQRIGRYRDLEHFQMIYPEKKIITAAPPYGVVIH